MPKENFIDRVQSAQQNINNGYQNEEQRKTAEVRRELEEIGVISAFQEIIDKGIITTEEGSQSPIHIEYGVRDNSLDLGKGYFLVFYDYSHRWNDREGYDNANISKKAIGITIGEVYPNKKYEVGGYKVTNESLLWERCRERSYEYIFQKSHIERSDVLDTLATAIAILKHNQEQQKKGTSNFLRFP